MMKKSALPLILLAGIVAGVIARIRFIFGPEYVFRNPVKAPPETGMSKHVLSSGGLLRGYLLFVPSRYRPDSPSALVLSLHGFRSNAPEQKYMTRWDEVAERENFCVVYPQGTGDPLHWHASEDYGGNQVDDVAFIRDLISELKQILSIDTQRIYVNGMSNGGSMSARLAVDMADTFAAVGIVSGPTIQLPERFQQARPEPLIAFYGTADPLVNYTGGPAKGTLLTWLLRIPRRGAVMPSVQAWIDAWAQRNGCDAVPVPLLNKEDTSGIRYVNCQDGAEVIFYTIHGGGHTWPGGRLSPIGKTGHGVLATEEMWAFFQNHPLTVPPSSRS